MRVIAGAQKGRRLFSSEGLGVRPTSARVKEAVFSIIGDRIYGSIFLDLFAGSGGIGIEALSRGAQRVVFVDSSLRSMRLLRRNLGHCRLPHVDIYRKRGEDFLAQTATGTTFDIVFADPPYHLDSTTGLLPAVSRSVMLALHTIVILEHSTKDSIPDRIGRLGRLRQYRYGDTSLSTFRVTEETIPA
jgi:16S rRNA (guanine966-N2)-methyltransferase